MQPIMAAHRQVLEARIALEARERKQAARLKEIVRRGHATVRSLEPRAASPLGPRRQATTTTAQVLPMADVRTSRSGRNGICPLTTAIADIRSRALTIRRPHARTLHRELILHRAAAIQLRLIPTPHPAAAIAAEAAAIAAGVRAVVAEAAAIAAVAVEAAAAAEAEARTAGEVPARTAGTNLFANSKACPMFRTGPLFFRRQLRMNFS